MTWWQLGQVFVGLLFHLTLSGSSAPDALLIFVAILLPSTNHDVLQSIKYLSSQKRRKKKSYKTMQSDTKTTNSFSLKSPITISEIQF